MLETAVVEKNMEDIRTSIARFLGRDGQPFKIVNNMDWYSGMNVVTFLRDVATLFRVQSMMARDSVKLRTSSTNIEGISLTELAYQALQGYDFLHLFKSDNCILQIGGGDQWGNILSGTQLIRKSLGQDSFGLTLPLLTDSAGKKIGKSTGRAIWLSPSKTSPFEFYQYWVRTADADIPLFLKLFTFLSMPKIAEICQAHAQHPEQFGAQRALADEVTRLVHGQEALKSAQAETEALFGNDDSLDAASLQRILKDAQKIDIRKSETVNLSLVELAFKAQVCSTKSGLDVKVNNH
jgi:tyrosyl-tRNA synthetase